MLEWTQSLRSQLLQWMRYRNNSWFFYFTYTYWINICDVSHTYTLLESTAKTEFQFIHLGRKTNIQMYNSLYTFFVGSIWNSLFYKYFAYYLLLMTLQLLNETNCYVKSTMVRKLSERVVQAFWPLLLIHNINETIDSILFRDSFILLFLDVILSIISIYPHLHMSLIIDANHVWRNGKHAKGLNELFKPKNCLSKDIGNLFRGQVNIL
jgi:hypothetical protein